MTPKKIIFSVVTIAFLLRLAALTYGIPQSFAADELVSVLGALTILEHGHLVGTSLLYLPPLLAYMLAPLIGFFGVVGMILGFFHGIGQFREFAIFHFEYFLIFSRLLSALLGTAAVWVVYLIGRKVFSERAGIFAMAMLCFSFMHVHESQVGRFWGPATFFIIFGVYALIRMYEERSWRWYMAAAAAIGFGYGIGYVPLVLLPWFFGAHFSSRPDLLLSGELHRKERLWDKKFLSSLSLLIVLCIFFSLANPYAFSRQFGWLTAGAADVFGIKIQHLTQKTVGTNVLNNIRMLFFNLWSESPLLLALGIAGLIGFFQRNKEKVFTVSLLLWLPWLYAAGMVFGFHKIDWRFVLPMVPFLVLGASYAFFVMYDQWKQRVWRIALILCYAIGFIGYSLWPTLAYVTLLQKTDTRIEAVRWIKQNIPAGSNIILDDYTLYLPLDVGSVEELMRLNPNVIDTRRSEILRHPAYGALPFHIYEMNRLEGSAFSVENIKAGFIVYSYWHEGQKREYEERYKNVRKELAVSFRPVPDFTPVRDLVNDPSEPEKALNAVYRPGPYVEIYRIIR